MSETKDTFLYNYYDFISSIYIYSHVKTYLVDPSRQKVERVFDFFLAIMSGIFSFSFCFKFIIIIFYFFILQSIPALIKFIIALFRLKCDINFKSSCKNAFSLLKKIGKRMFTFNFYLYENNLIGFIMIFIYLLFLFSATYFYIDNQYQSDHSEKSENYMIMFYLHFESVLFIQLLCSSFYSCQNMKLSTLSAIIHFVFLNIIIFLGYLIKENIENAEGIFLNKEPQLIMNSVLNFFLLLLNGKSFFNAVYSNKNSKKKI